jgi:hypothetical protein
VNALERARLESRPLELAGKVLGYVKLAEPDTSDSMSVAEWQRKVNEAALLREIVGQFVAGMDGNEVLAYVDSIITAQSIYAMPSQTELFQLRESVAGLIRDAERYRHLRDGGLGYLPYEDHGCGPEYPHHEELDAAIDQARGKGVQGA